jgi:acyl-coenzyme A thioesterase PaaI-like protein
MRNEEKWIKARNAWLSRKPGRLIGRGHPIGDFLEAHKWRLLEEGKGYLRVEAHLPARVRNLREQLFGGFTPTYVDFLSLYTVRAGSDRTKPWGFWLATTSLRVDYFEPVTGPHFVIESRLIKERGRTLFVETRFLDQSGHLAVFAVANLRKLSMA